MQLIPIWTECTTKIWQFKGIITEISIRDKAILYNVSYEKDWIQNMLFYEFELEFWEINKESIWFKIQ